MERNAFGVRNAAVSAATNFGHSAEAPIVGPALTERNGTDRVMFLPPELSPLTGLQPRNVAWAFENANAAIRTRKKSR